MDIYEFIKTQIRPKYEKVPLPLPCEELKIFLATDDDPKGKDRSFMKDDVTELLKYHDIACQEDLEEGEGLIKSDDKDILMYDLFFGLKAKKSSGKLHMCSISALFVDHIIAKTYYYISTRQSLSISTIDKLLTLLAPPEYLYETILEKKREEITEADVEEFISKNSKFKPDCASDEWLKFYNAFSSCGSDVKRPIDQYLAHIRVNAIGGIYLQHLRDSDVIGEGRSGLILLLMDDPDATVRNRASVVYSRWKEYNYERDNKDKLDHILQLKDALTYEWMNVAYEKTVKQTITGKDIDNMLLGVFQTNAHISMKEYLSRLIVANLVRDPSLFTHFTPHLIGNMIQDDNIPDTILRDICSISLILFAHCLTTDDIRSIVPIKAAFKIKSLHNIADKANLDKTMVGVMGCF